MRKILIACILILGVKFTVFADNWNYNLDEAKKIALATNKLILVDFWATWCGPCKKMDAESWSKDEVKLLMDNYVPVKIDIDNNKNLANRYGVKAIPFVFILDGNGTVVYKSMSYKSKDEVIELLKNYALNTSYLSNEMLSFYKKKNFITTYRLAEKYQDYATYLNEEVLSNFLNVSQTYFDMATEKLESSSLQNKDAFAQKINLFNIQAKLIQNKPKKGLKMLKKVSNDNIHDINMPFYVYLNYTAQKLLGNDTEASKWEDKLSSKQLKKSEKIINLNI